MVLMLAGAYTFVTRRDTAAWLHDYYRSRPDPKWRPPWLPWAFRPSGTQAMVMAWLFSLAILAFGVGSFLFGIGVDLRDPFG